MNALFKFASYAAMVMLTSMLSMNAFAIASTFSNVFITVEKLGPEGDPSTFTIGDYAKGSKLGTIYLSPYIFGGSHSINQVILYSFIKTEVRDPIPPGVNLGELQMPGWKLSSVVCKDTDSNQDLGTYFSGTIADTTTPIQGISFNVNFFRGEGNDQHITCTFTNVKLGSISVHKEFSSGGVTGPAADYKFSVDGGAVVATDNTGMVSFPNLDSGPHTLCEEQIPAGQHSSLADEPDAYYPIPMDNSKVCLTVLLAEPAGVFAVDNVVKDVVNTLVPTGEPRSKGYWKNWSSCTNGGQWAKGEATEEVDTLDEALNSGPIQVGPITVNTCEEGVAILDQNLLDGNSTNNASDGAAKLAAQLLAAKLNAVAGQLAGCSSAASYIGQGDLLLNNVGYDATAPVLYPKNKALANDRNSALGIADALEMLNNGDCP